MGEIFLTGLFMLTATYLGYLMGKGDKLELPKSLRFAVRNDAQEVEVQKKIEKRALDGRR